MLQKKNLFSIQTTKKMNAKIRTSEKIREGGSHTSIPRYKIDENMRRNDKTYQWR